MTDAQYTSPMKKDEELDPELFHVAREKERRSRIQVKYVETKDKGMYMCAICGTTLFSSDTKFDSGTGWSSFTEPANLEHITLLEDTRCRNEKNRSTLQDMRCALRARIR